MQRPIRLGLAALAGAFLLAAARPASADFTVCSEFKQTVYVAYAYHDGTDWVSEGWWSVYPFDCTVVWTGPIDASYLYLFAESEDGRTSWGGEYMFCIHEPNAFTIWGDEDCHTGFLEIDLGGARDWTHTLTP